MTGVRAAEGDPLGPHSHDWDWLLGEWDVHHVRLRKRLAHNNDWDEFPGRSAFWRTLGGLGNVDDNLLHIPSGLYRAISIRSFDPVARQWAIWWLDGRNSATLDPPVRGAFQGSEGVFFGNDVHNGASVTVRFRWHEIHSARPHWDQAYSTDGGKTWEINWRNYFTRTARKASPLPLIENEAPAAERNDWAFLEGRWSVRNRRLRARLVGSKEWEEFQSTFTNWPVMGGLGNIGDNVFDAPGGAYRGMSVRAFDRTAKQWSSWWLDGRTPTVISSGLRGAFSDGVGTFVGDDSHEGRPIKVRSQWTNLAGQAPRWEQAASADGGRTWETNWIADFTRA